MENVQAVEGESVAENEQINAAGLREAYADPIAQKMLDYFAGRAQNPRFTTAEYICTALGLPRTDVIHVFQKLEGLKIGHYVVGRRGQPTRFEWHKPMRTVGMAAGGDMTTPAEIKEHASEEKVQEVTDYPTLNHTFRLREKGSVHFKLPKDLTKHEAERLADWIKTLPFNTN